MSLTWHVCEWYIVSLKLITLTHAFIEYGFSSDHDLNCYINDLIIINV